MELRLEVLHAQDLVSAEYRLGDLGCSLLGLKDLRPFVEVTFQSQRRLSCPVHAKGGTAVFDWNACFDLDERERRCKFRVYDRRGAQAALRGDPLIGEAELPLADGVSSAGLLATFTLRNGRVSTGQLTVHYELQRPSGAQLCPGSALLGTALGRDLVAPAASGEDMLPCRAAPCALELATRAGPSVERSRSLGSTPKGAPPSAAGRERPLGLPAPGCDRPPRTLEWVSSSLEREHGRERSESSDSCESFCSACEEPDSLGAGPSQGPPLAPPRGLQHHHRCEGAAEAYVRARAAHDLAALEALLAPDAVLTVPKPLGGSSAHHGWREIEAYLKGSPARPGCFRDLRHVHTEVGGPCEGSAETTVVRWAGRVYKLGCWHQLHFDFVIDSLLLIRSVKVAQAR